MSNNDLNRLRHIRDASEKILQITLNKSLEDFIEDELISLASIHLIEIIGEAANDISSLIVESHPEVPWTSIIGMRNRLIHKYYDINLEIVWNTIIKDIPSLFEKINEIIASLENSE